MSSFFDAVGKFFSEQLASSSTEAYDINVLFQEFLIFSAIILLLIGGLIFISIVRFREKKQPNEPRQIFGSKNLEIIWTAVPFFIVTLFFILTVRTMEAINPPVENSRQPDIVIIARQWWWDMKYTKENIRTANELHVPAGKKLLIRFESPDVIHDWWVPELGPKMDVVPGQTNYLWINAQKSGRFEGACSEYCGAEHAWMRILTIAEDQRDFNKWVQSQKSHTAALNSSGKQGAIIFQKKTCVNCHSIEGISNAAYIGPDLTHLASRQTLLSGMFPNTKENLTRWLIDPQKVKPGAHMPNFRLSSEELKAMVNYLEELK